jgi:hypothetical protein
MLGYADTIRRYFIHPMPDVLALVPVGIGSCQQHQKKNNAFFGRK